MELYPTSANERPISKHASSGLSSIAVLRIVRPACKFSGWKMEDSLIITLVCYLIAAVVLVRVSFYFFRFATSLFQQNEAIDQQNHEKIIESTEQKQKEVNQRKKKKTRSVKQEFKHSMLYSTLKCVKGEVCDMDFSNNGKYLATCSTVFQVEDSHSPVVPDRLTNMVREHLSRRQRKNRKEKNTAAPQIPIFELDLPTKQWLSFGYDEAALAHYLQKYFLSSEAMYASGYPSELEGTPYGTTYIYKYPWSQQKSKHAFNINAREFVPRLQAEDSAYSSSNSSDSDESYEDMTIFNYVEPGVFEPESNQQRFFRECVRCTNFFEMDENNEVIHKNFCQYHTGIRVNKISEVEGDKVQPVKIWNCCDKDISSPGCSLCVQHVWSGTSEGINGPFYNFVKTSQIRNRFAGVYALDCEMSFTKNGLELTKVSVVNIHGKIVYNSFVKPDDPIVDYNTRFSGVTARNLSGKNVKSLREVQNDLMGFIGPDTILVGHSLDNDLKALKIIHEKVVDTASMYPHAKGYPYKESLKALSLKHLQMEIQCDAKGHSADEDAFAALNLAVSKILKDLGH